jgi:hypothetical protein
VASRAMVMQQKGIGNPTAPRLEGRERCHRGSVPARAFSEVYGGATGSKPPSRRAVDVRRRAISGLWVTSGQGLVRWPQSRATEGTTTAPAGRRRTRAPAAPARRSRARTPRVRRPPWGGSTSPPEWLWGLTFQHTLKRNGTLRERGFWVIT